ncbi:MAG TPA: hypothetical protein VEB22_06150, partial [Phycisphaerales bacterium]|nr:hypothetical protein [Phycisphaerales bacterium]
MLYRIGVDTAAARREVDELVKKLDGLDGHVGKFGRSSSSSFGGASKAASGFAGTLMSVGRGVGIVAAGVLVAEAAMKGFEIATTAAGSALRAVIQTGISFNSMMQNAEIGFAGYLG